MLLALVSASPAIRRFPVRPEWIELLAGLLAGAILAAAWSRPAGRLERIGSTLRKTARRRVLWVVAFALLGPCIRLALIPVAPIPFPAVHDEFVNLLAADTLLHGRLANPPHPCSGHFETIYVIQKPTYSASYPPGTAAFLAVAWKVTGQPWLGAWMSMVLCCGAVAWMQYRWLPPLAAWTGGLLCSLSLGISSVWMNSYSGGGVSAAGGALVIGALPALLATARLRYAWILSMGWTLVWFTRPYESMILGLVSAAAILAWLWRNRGESAGRRLALASLLVAGIAALDVAGMCYDNWRVTGDPLLSPYRLTQRVYGVPHAFVWQAEVPEPEHLTPQQRRIYLYQRNHFRTARSLTGMWPLLGDELKKVWAFYIGYPLTIPFAIGLFSSSRKTRNMRLLLGAGMLWSLLYPRIVPQYLAPLTGLWFALGAYGLLRMSRWRPGGRPWGVALAVGLSLASAAGGLRVLYPWYLFGGAGPLTQRGALTRQLEATPGLHLVFVRYGPQHVVHDEWVYNRADIDHAKVVWANDLGERRNRQLIRYLGDRHVWLVEPDTGARLQPYLSSPASVPLPPEPVRKLCGVPLKEPEPRSSGDDLAVSPWVRRGPGWAAGRNCCRPAERPPSTSS
jgi:hypothetical protein